MRPMSTEQFERAVVALLQRLNPQLPRGEVESRQPNHPDCRIAGSSTGVEVTRLNQPGGQDLLEVGNFERQVCKRVREAVRDRAPSDTLIILSFSPMHRLDKKSWSSIADLLADRLRDGLALQTSFVVAPAQLPDELLECYVDIGTGVSAPTVVPTSGGGLWRLTPDIVQSVVDGKETKLHLPDGYRAHCYEVILALAIGNWDRASLVEIPEECLLHTYTCSFDGVFIVNTMFDAVIPLSTTLPG